MFIKPISPTDDYSPHTPKQLLIYGYLFMNRTMRDEVVLSLEHLVKSCGYKISNSENAPINKFRQELYDMYQKDSSGYFEMYTETDILTVKPKDIFVIDLSIIPYTYNRFTKITFDDYDKIVRSQYLNKDNLLYVYLYLKSHIYERKKDQYGNDVEIIKDKPEACFLSYEQISNETGLSKQSIVNIIHLLQNMKLIECYTTGGYKDKDNKIRNAPNIYTLYGHKNEIPYMIDYLKEYYSVDKFFPITKKQNEKDDDNGTQRNNMESCSR